MQADGDLQERIVQAAFQRFFGDRTPTHPFERAERSANGHQPTAKQPQQTAEKAQPANRPRAGRDSRSQQTDNEQPAPQGQSHAPGIGCFVADAAFRAIRIGRQRPQAFLKSSVLAEQPQAQGGIALVEQLPADCQERVALDTCNGKFGENSAGLQDVQTARMAQSCSGKFPARLLVGHGCPGLQRALCGPGGSIQA